MVNAIVAPLCAALLLISTLGFMAAMDVKWNNRILRTLILGLEVFIYGLCIEAIFYLASVMIKGKP